VKSALGVASTLCVSQNAFSHGHVLCKRSPTRDAHAPREQSYRSENKQRQDYRWNTNRSALAPRGKLDCVLMVDVYHELSHPQIILGNIAAALKPSGKLVLIEFRRLRTCINGFGEWRA
jgi:hypothetical protein